MQNYFELFGLKPSFVLNEAALHKAYVSAQQAFHPDRLVGKPDAERAKAVQISMDANDGYEVLKSPLLRAQHLLALQGIVVNADEKDTHAPSQALLMETLELREALAEADGEPEIARHVHDIKAAMKQTEKELSESFVSQNYDGAAQLTIKMRYLGKALEDALMQHYRIKQMVGA